MKRSRSEDDPIKRQKLAQAAQAAQPSVSALEADRKQEAKETSSSDEKRHVTSSSDEKRQVTSSAGTGESSDNKKASTSSSSSTPHESSGHGSDEREPGGTYPHPSNFAERVMHVLENEIAPDSIYWLEDGESIAIHPEKTKDSSVLESHFQAQRFSTFLRTMTRWGFRRVTNRNMPEPIIVVHNSLFQREKPHLVQHMQMDSDVQDIFAVHQKNMERQRMEEEKGAAGLTAESHAQHPAAAAQKQPQPHHQPDVADTQALQQRAQELISESYAQQGQQQMPSFNLGASLPAAAGGQQQQAHGDREGQAMETLQRLLHLAQEYLNLSSPNDPEVATLRSLLQLLLVIGQRHLQYCQEQRQQRQQRITQNTIQELLSQLSHLTQQQQQQQQQQSQQHSQQHQQQQSQQQQQQSQQQEQQGQESQAQAPSPATVTQLGANLLQEMLLQQNPAQIASLAPENIVASIQQALQQGGQQSGGPTLPQQLLQMFFQQQPPPRGDPST